MRAPPTRQAAWSVVSRDYELSKIDTLGVLRISVSVMNMNM